MRALNPQTIRKAVQLALDEDLDHGDVTTSALFPRAIQAKAAIVAHQQAHQRVIVQGANRHEDQVHSHLRHHQRQLDPERLAEGTHAIEFGRLVDIL